MRVCILLVLLMISGCCTQVKAAALQHAQSTETVAKQLEMDTARIECAAMQDATKQDNCKEALKDVQLQVDTLRQGGQTLKKEVE